MTPAEAPSAVPAPGDTLYKVEEVAALWRVGRGRVFDLVMSGELESYKIGKARRIAQSQLDAYLERVAQRASSGTPAA